MAQKDFKVDSLSADFVNVKPTTTTVNTTSATEVYSFDPSLYGTAELTMQVTQGSKRTSQKAFVNHDGTDALITNYAVLEHGATRIPLAVSADYIAPATTWVTRTSNIGNTIMSVAFGNNLWVAGGYSGPLRTSTDAITWTTRTSNFGNTQIRSVAFGNSLWVAGGWNGQLRTSTDAITWVTRTSNIGNTTIRSVAHGNNLWVAVAYSGQIRTSTDAITWTTRTSGSGYGGPRLNFAVYANNLWVVGGTPGQGGNNPSPIRTSTDGITWVYAAIDDSTRGAYCAAFGDYLWIVGKDRTEIFIENASKRFAGITATVTSAHNEDVATAVLQKTVVTG